MEERRVRICDLAEELGLSTATVSNVIHGKTQKVSDATVQRVTALLEEREYIPNMAGILLAQNDSRIIGVFVNDHEKYEGRTLSDFFIAESLNELSTQIEKTGRFMMAGAFTALCLLCPGAIMRDYTADVQTLQTAAGYLRLLAGTYLPMAGATMLAAAFRCAEKPRLPLYAGIASALLNTVLNDLLIFGKCGFAAMGATGAGIATVLSQWVNFLLMLLFCRKTPPLPAADGRRTPPVRGRGRQYLAMLLPLLICEVTWSLGENVYAAIYGRMGTDASAAMTLTGPVQGLVIGALCGLSQAAGVIVGKRLGSGDEDAAYAAGKRLLVYGAAGAALLSVLVVLLSGVYVEIYQVEDGVKRLTRQILTAYALVAPCKVLNMILGGGILRSGGRTAYVMAIDLVGTWGFGVPAGLLTAFVFALPVPYVYFALSLEECLRFGISLAVFRRRRWMRRLPANTD